MALVEINWRPDKRRLREFGAAAAVLLAALGGWAVWRHTLFGVTLEPATARTAAEALWIAAGLVAALTVAVPAALRPIYVGLSVVALPIGVAVSYIILAVLFYGVITSVGLVMRLVRRDPLRRRFDPAERTYWTRREPPAEKRRYFRQF